MNYIQVSFLFNLLMVHACVDNSHTGYLNIDLSLVTRTNFPNDAHAM